MSSTKTKLVIFGISGDLSRRKLLPALAQIKKSKEVDDVEIIGVSRRKVEISSLGKAASSLDIRMMQLDLDDTKDYEKLKKEVDSSSCQVLLYLSVPPLATESIVENLGEARINGDNVKLLLEKPFGVDFNDSQRMIKKIRQYFKEENIYRIDHYLAKEMSQNIVSFRFSNALLTRIWNKDSIECVEIIATEQIDIEGRADFYEQTGALRDFLQGHMMQLLALVLMRIPEKFDWSDMPRLREEALASVAPAIAEKTTRGQYEGYKTEVKNENSQVETFVKVELSSDDGPLKGVPLTLVTGKAMAKKTSEICVRLRKEHGAQSDKIVFKIQPDEGIEIELMVKKPGYSKALEPRKLSFTYPDDEHLPDAYEQVLVDAIRSEKSLFATSEEILQSWRILQPLLDAWNSIGTRGNSNDNLPIRTYKKGDDWRKIAF